MSPTMRCCCGRWVQFRAVETEAQHLSEQDIGEIIRKIMVSQNITYYLASLILHMLSTTMHLAIWLALRLPLATTTYLQHSRELLSQIQANTYLNMGINSTYNKRSILPTMVCK